MSKAPFVPEDAPQVLSSWSSLKIKSNDGVAASCRLSAKGQTLALMRCVWGTVAP